MIIDELELSGKDKKQITERKPSDLEKLLQNLKERKHLTLIVISASSLLEINHNYGPAQQIREDLVSWIWRRMQSCQKSADKKDLRVSQLKERLKETGCAVFQLENVMRNTKVHKC